MHSALQTRVAQYGAALVAAGLATWVRLLLQPYLGPQLPFVTYFVALVGIAWYGGLGPSLLLVTLGGVAAAHWLLPPEGSLLPADGAGWVVLGVYLIAGYAMAAGMHPMHSDRRRASAAVTRERQPPPAAVADSLAQSPVSGVPPLDRRTGVFLRELTHEVSNALHPLRLIVQILKEPDLDPAMLQRLRTTLEAQMPAVEQLLRDLRRISIIARGAVDPQPASLDPAGMLRMVGIRFRARAEQAGLQFDAQIPETLPPLEADADLLERAIEELLDNAVRHTPSSGRIRLTAEQRAGELAITVADSGCGIKPELLPHVFEVFVRGDEEEHISWGRFGLGLALVRQVAEKHGGRVEAQSAGPGHGAQFTLHVPCAAPTADRRALTMRSSA